MDVAVMQLLLKHLRLHGKQSTLKVINQFIKNKENKEGISCEELRVEMIDFINSVCY